MARFVRMTIEEDNPYEAFNEHMRKVRAQAKEIRERGVEKLLREYGRVKLQEEAPWATTAKR